MIVIIVSLYHYIWLPNEYTRRMDWSGLIQTLEEQATTSDTIIIYLYEIEDNSLKKVSLWDRGIQKINLSSDRTKSLAISDYANALDQETKGTIFVVNNETDRHLVDPDSELLVTLAKLRPMSERRYGRNLILYRFEKT